MVFASEHRSLTEANKSRMTACAASSCLLNRAAMLHKGDSKVSLGIHMLVTERPLAHRRTSTLATFSGSSQFNHQLSSTFRQTMAYTYDIANGTTFLTDNLLGSPASAEGSDIYAHGINLCASPLTVRDYRLSPGRGIVTRSRSWKSIGRNGTFSSVIQFSRLASCLSLYTRLVSSFIFSLSTRLQTLPALLVAATSFHSLFSLTPHVESAIIARPERSLAVSCATDLLLWSMCSMGNHRSDSIL